MQLVRYWVIALFKIIEAYIRHNKMQTFSYNKNSSQMAICHYSHYLVINKLTITYTLPHKSTHAYNYSHKL